MDGVQGMPMAPASSAENDREKAQKAQEQKSPLASLAFFSGHSVGKARRAEAGSSPVKKVRPIRLFFAPLSFRAFAFLAHSSWLKNEGQSSSVKLGQTDSVGQAAGQNPCKTFKMNSLQNKQLYSSQTMVNLVTYGQNKPILSGLEALQSRLYCGTLNRLTSAFSILPSAFPQGISLPPSLTRPTI